MRWRVSRLLAWTGAMKLENSYTYSDTEWVVNDEQKAILEDVRVPDDILEWPLREMGGWPVYKFVRAFNLGKQAMEFMSKWSRKAVEWGWKGE